MRITWHGHSCFEITDSKNLVVDPHDGISLGLRRPDTTADIVAITHDHFDHNRVDLVSTSETKLVNGPGCQEQDGISLHGFEGYHDKSQGRLRGKVVMYRILVDGIRCLHVGDLGQLPDRETIEAIGPIDILFVPVGGKFTIDSRDAVKLMELVDPLITVPMHFWKPGVCLEIEGVLPFLKHSDLPVLKVGSAIDFDRDDLPDYKEIWLFDC